MDACTRAEANRCRSVHTMHVEFEQTFSTLPEYIIFLQVIWERNGYGLSCGGSSPLNGYMCFLWGVSSKIAINGVMNLG